MTWNGKTLTLEEVERLIVVLKRDIKIIRTAICALNHRLNRLEQMPFYDDGCFDEDELHG